MALEGQQIVVPHARYQALAVLGASDSARYADGAFEDYIYFCSRDKRQARRLMLEGLDLYRRAEGRWTRSSTLSLYEYAERPDKQIGKGI